MPETYFKYLSVTAATSVLSNQTLRWTTCSTFNDPADMQIDLHAQCDRDQVLPLALDKLWRRCQGDAPPGENRFDAFFAENAKRLRTRGREEFDKEYIPHLSKVLDLLAAHTKKLSDELREPLTTVKVICFSERRDSNLMWSHYSESHAGLVLEFQNIVDLDSPYKSARAINYSAQAPQLGDNEAIAGLLAGERPDSDAIFDRLVYSKSVEWEYEKEWRIASGGGRNPENPIEYIPFNTRELKAVYFGCRTAQGTRNLLIPLIRHRYPDAEIWKARRESHTYTLRFDRIDNEGS